MKAKEYMLQARNAKRAIDRKLDAIQTYADMTTHITSSIEMCKVAGKEVGMEKVTNSKIIQDKMADAVASIIDAQDELKVLIDEYIEIVNDITITIEKLTSAHYKILFDYYINDKDFVDIAADEMKSYSAVTTQHSRALNALQKLLDGDNDDC